MDVIDAINHVRRTVYEQTGVELEGGQDESVGDLPVRDESRHVGQGIIDVRSGADGVGLDGTPYSEW